jgi:hypothetical protein
MKSDDPLLSKLGEVLRTRRDREGDAPLGDESGHKDVFAPLPHHLRASIVERALAGVAEAPASQATASTPAASVLPIETARPRSKRRRPITSTVGAFVVLAAAGWLLWPGPKLPPYTLTVEGGDSQFRSATDQVPGAGQPVVVTAGSQLEFVLRPAKAIGGPVEARLYVVASPGAPPVVTNQSPEVAPGGSVRWKGSPRELLGERTGDVELLLVVSHKSSHPDITTLAAGQTDHGRGWQSFRKRVRVINER